MTNDLESPCCNSWVRAQMDSTARVAISPENGIVDFSDFTTDEVDDDTLYCEECGKDLELALELIDNDHYSLKIKI